MPLYNQLVDDMAKVTARLQQVRIEGRNEVFEAWKESVNNDVSAEVKLGLTWSKYRKVRLVLGHDKIGEEWVPKRVGKTALHVPLLASRYQINALPSASLQALGWQETQDNGKIGVVLDAEACIQVAEKRADKSKLEDEHGFRHLQIQADAARVFRNTDVVNCGIRYLWNDDAYNQADALSQVFCVEGGDCYDNLYKPMEGLRR